MKVDIKYLENRLSELHQDLIKTELKINEETSSQSEKIDLLEKNLKLKKEELAKQQLLEEKIRAFEKRITDTEKANTQQAELEIKINQMENEIEQTSDHIYSKNQDIEKKTNYIEMKINSYNESRIKELKIDEDSLNATDSDVVPIRSYESDNNKSAQQLEEEKSKKHRFFWPGLAKK